VVDGQPVLEAQLLGAAGEARDRQHVAERIEH
jgi:hypothetical protein